MKNPHPSALTAISVSACGCPDTLSCAEPVQEIVEGRRSVVTKPLPSFVKGGLPRSGGWFVEEFSLHTTPSLRATPPLPLYRGGEVCVLAFTTTPVLQLFLGQAPQERDSSVNGFHNWPQGQAV